MIKMPAIMVEKPKISRPMWLSLKHHITRERQRKKQEQEADAEVERQRREREDQQKEQEMTLEETKEQVAQYELRLSQLKEDKHQLFLQLKKVLNEDDTRRKIKESNFHTDMMLLHGYPQGAQMGVPGNHASAVYMQNLGQSRPVYKGGKEESIMSIQGGPPPPSLYGQSISLIPSMSYQGGQPNAKRSRSPSPPPQLYHSYKPHSLSPYSSKGVGNPYGGSPAVPGSIFYTHSVSVSAAHSAAGSYQLAPGAMYSFPPSQPSSSSSRPSYSAPADNDGPPPAKQHAGLYIGSSSSVPQRNHAPRSTGPPMTQGYHNPPTIEHLMSKNSSSYGPSEQEKFFLSSHGPAPSGSSSGSGGGNSSSSSSSGLRPHGGLVTPVPLTGASHPSGIPIHQPSHGKGGSITSGHPIQHPQRAPPSTANHGQSVPRLVYTQSGGQGQPPPHSSRYYGNPN